MRVIDIDAFADWTETVWTGSKTGRNEEKDLLIAALGLGGEAGEVLEHIKKHFRDNKLDKDEVKKELGDVIYYWARLCRHMGFRPSNVIDANIDKITSRKRRGVLRGDGDNR